MPSQGDGGVSALPPVSTSPPSSSSSGPAAPPRPPPRAALSSTSSPSPPDDQSHHHHHHHHYHAGRRADANPRSRRGNSSGGSSSGSGGGSTASASRSPTPPDGAAAAEEAAKDARIAGLERALAEAEEAFRRELARREGEASAFWQARHGVLQQQLARAEAELREERAAGRELRAQVRGLKEWVSTSTRADGLTQTSDEVFGEGMARLGNGLQNWVIVNFRRARLDLSRADGPALDELGRLVPAYENLPPASKIHLLQSIVSRILVELVFDSYFVGLPPEQALRFAEMEALLSSFASSAEPINQWRSLTLTILKRDAASKLREETSRIEDAVVGRVNGLLGSITDASSTAARDQGLRALVSGAVDLSRLLAVQKAVFTVSVPEILPHQKSMFDPFTMEDIGGEDEESLTRRDICCVTFPGITKTGDENGGHLQYKNVISKARVLCSPE